MILILLACIAVPLRRALLQVANETSARATVQGELKHLAPADAIVSQQVSVGKDEIVIRLISTRAIPDSKVEEARQDLVRRTGRDVQLSVDAVASKSELAELMQRLARPPPVPPKAKIVAEMQRELVDRVRLVIQEIWPSSDAPIQDFDVILSTAGVALDVRYQGVRDLGDVPVNMVLQHLRTKLAMPDLTLKVERTRPPRANAKRKGL